MKKLSYPLGLVALLAILFSMNLAAQDMPRTVIGSAGDYYQSIQVGNLHWTVGEIAVSRHQNGLELGEGFHHGYYDLLVKIDDPLPADWEVSVYPNPTTDWVKLRFPEEEELNAQLFDANGKLLFQDTGLSAETILDMAFYPEGVYFLRLSDENNRQHSVQIMKVRL